MTPPASENSFFDRFSATRIAILFIIIYIGLGLVWTLLYIDLPMVRNSILYGGIVRAIEQYGVFSAADYAYNKPLGFAILSLPFTQMAGINAGLKLSSMFWTGVWSIVVLIFLKNQESGTNPDKRRLFLAVFITLFNPLTFYQFFSAYPDTLFSALFIVSLLFFDRALKHGKITDAVLSALLAFLSVWVKHHGFILLPIFAVLSIVNRHDIAGLWRSNKVAIYALVFSFSTLIALFVLAQYGKLPLFNIGRNTNNFLGGHDRFDIIADNTGNLFSYLILTFGVLTPFLLCWKSYWKQRQFMVILALFVLPILYYKGAKYNIRYFIAITPVLAWIATDQILKLSPKARRIFLVSFFSFNAFTILYYNNIGFNAMVSKTIQLPAVDNLRLISEQKHERDVIEKIAQLAPQYDNTLIFLSTYYKDNPQQIWELSGLLPAGLKVYYAKRWKHKLLEQYNLDKAIIYEYVGVGKPGNRVKRDRRIRQRIKKVGPRMYLLDSARNRG